MQLHQSGDQKRIRSARLGTAGFNLVELLVIIAIIAILIAMLMPALAKGSTKSLAITCMNNNKQLVLAWMMYANDAADRLLSSEPNRPTRSPKAPVWFTGNISGFPASSAERHPTGVVNTDFSNSPMRQYLGDNPAVLRCPADRSIIRGGNLTPRIRSYSMSHVFGSGEWLNNDQNKDQAVWKTFTKLTDITGTANTWLFIEEHPNAINDASFAVACTGADTPNAAIIDYPAPYHDGASGLAFADGHSEIHKWTGVTIRNAAFNFTSNEKTGPFTRAAGDSWVDMRWLADKTTTKN